MALLRTVMWLYRVPHLFLTYERSRFVRTSARVERLGQSEAEPSPGYAGVSLSLAKTELNACGLNSSYGFSRTDSFRLNPIGTGRGGAGVR